MRHRLTWPKETRLRGWPCKTRTQKCRRKLSLWKVAEISWNQAEFWPPRPFALELRRWGYAARVYPADACVVVAQCLRRTLPGCISLFCAFGMRLLFRHRMKNMSVIEPGPHQVFEWSSLRPPDRIEESEGQEFRLRALRA